MEHSTPLPSAQPWRAAALVAAAIAAVELFILVLIGVAFSAQFFAGEVKKAAAVLPAAAAEQPAVQPAAAPSDGEKAKKPEAKPLLPRSKTSVIVLNGNGIAGAAGVVAERIRPHGYVIAGSANAPRSDFARSVVMYRPGFEREAKRLAADLEILRVVPLDGMRARDLQGAHIAFIVGG